MRRLYFGHPINAYDTELEKFLLIRVAATFPDWEIVNPNSPVHSAGYKAEKQLSGNGMHYFLERVVPTCQTGVFLPFREGRFGMGVWSEASVLHQLNRPVWKISAQGILAPILNLRNEPPPLSVEETRERIKFPY